jgi:hypothetical protein
MIATSETVQSVFARGARVVCKGDAEGPYAKFEGKVAAAHENVIHLSLAGPRDPDTLVKVGGVLALQIAAGQGWFAATARRVQNVVPGGMTLRVLKGPARMERREYLRVRCELPLWWKPVDKNDIDQAAETMRDARRRNARPTEEVAGQPALRDIDDPRLAKLIGSLIKRVETLEGQVATLRGQRPETPAYEGRRDMVVDLSGAGVRITTEQTMRAGDILEGTIPFEDFDRNEVRFLARVVRVDLPNLGRPLPSMACRFVVLDDRDRELIIRYTFREHRRQLRESLV